MLLLDILVNGLIMGVLYGLMAVGLSLIFGILKVVNFAHGEFFMIGAYAYTLFALHLGFPPLVAILSAMLIGGGMGIWMERLLLRPLYTGYIQWGAQRDEYAIIMTFGLSLLLIHLANQVFGPYAIRGPQLVSQTRITLGPITMGVHRLVAFALGGGLLLIAFFCLRYTMWGKTIQAVAQNRFGASIAGINTARTSMLVVALAGMLTALSGALLAPIFHAYPQVGTFPAVKSFVIVVLGGMGSTAGSILGGVILGILETFGAIYISYAYRDAFGFLILILTLLFRPWGLLGEKAREV